MTFDRLVVWKFDSAPIELRSLHRGRKSPAWVAVIPRKIGGADLEAAIVTQAGLIALDRHQTEEGDVVYFGSSRSGPILGAIDLIRLDDFALNPDLRLRFEECEEKAAKRSKGASSV